MSDFMTYLWVSVGVLIAVIYPILRGYISDQFPATAGGIPPWLKKYLLLLLFCLVTGLIVLAVYKASNPDPITMWKALVLGFGWEAVVEKIFTKPSFAPTQRQP